MLPELARPDAGFQTHLDRVVQALRRRTLVTAARLGILGLGTVGLVTARPNGRLDRFDVGPGLRIEHAPAPVTVLPHLRTVLTSRVVVEQAKGFLRERLDVSVDYAFELLRSYARSRGDHLTEVSRRLITEPSARPAILAAISQIAAAPTS